MEIIYKYHATVRMTQENISKKEVSHVLDAGKAIENYSDDKPFPSKLILGWVNEKPIHVVIAEDKAKEILYVITVYRPTLNKWKSGYEIRIGR